MAKSRKSEVSNSIMEVLHQDHQLVRELFFQFKECEAEDDKEQIKNQILEELFIHSTAEEEIVYPATAEAAEDAEDLVLEAQNEHRVVKFLMAELSNMQASDEQFDAKMTVLCELVGHHIREEEKELFKKLRESGADLEELAEKVRERKESLKAQPLPVMQCSLTIGGNDNRKVAQTKKEKPRSTTKARKSA